MKRILFLSAFVICFSFAGAWAQEDPLTDQIKKDTAMDIPKDLFKKKVNPEAALRRYVPNATPEQIQWALSKPDASQREGILREAFGGLLNHDEIQRLSQEPDLQPNALQQYQWEKSHPQLMKRLENYRAKHPGATTDELRRAVEMGEVPSVELPKDAAKALGSDPAQAVRRLLPGATDEEIRKAVDNLSRQRTTGALHEVFPTLSDGQLERLLNDPALSSEAVRAYQWMKSHPELQNRVKQYKAAHPAATPEQIRKAIDTGRISTVEVPKDILSALGRSNPDPVQAIRKALPGVSDEKIKMALALPDFPDQKARWQNIFQTATMDQIERLLQHPDLQPQAVKQYKWTESHPDLAAQITGYKATHPGAPEAEVLRYLDQTRKTDQAR